MYKIVFVEEVGSTKDASSFLQSDFWASFKESHGWKPCHFHVKYQRENAEHSFYFTLLSKKLPFSFSIGYVPMFPNIMGESLGEVKNEFYSDILTEITKTFYNKCIFVRFDMDLRVIVDNKDGKASDGNEAVKRPTVLFKKSNGFYVAKSKTDIQPPDTVILDLTLSEDELLSQFKSKWRYNIRLSQKKGCIVKMFDMNEALDEGIDLFYKLYKTTSERDGIAIHSKNYYKSLFTLSRKHPNVSVRLYVAFYNEEPLSAIITMFYKDEATYLYGASSNEHRNLMATYLLQWQAIKEAKEYGCKVYDFYGIPPTDEPSHPMAGLYRFKTGFGGKIVHRIGSIDVFKSKILYTLYSWLENIRSVYYKKYKKRFIKRNK
ncbi:MAG: lipid II:glycine glycyltransferase FemX [Treponema sp.]